MKANLTDISIILDESGSMNSVRAATLENLLSFVNTQKVQGEENVFSLFTFNQDVYNRFITRDSKVIEDSDFTKYRPGGATALYYAVCKVIDDIGERLRKTPEELRPARVLVCIITDGEDNVPVIGFRAPEAQQRIKHQQEKYGWTFVFLGANIDVEKTVTELGISFGNANSFEATSRGIKHAVDKMTQGTNTYKTCAVPGASYNNFFDKGN